MMHLFLFLMAALVSALGTVAGFGGGIFIVPIMVIGFKVPIEVAVGIAALSLFPASCLSTYFNIRSKTVDFKLMVLLEIPTMIGAVLGAHFTSLIPTRPLEIIFAVFLFFLSWRILKPSELKSFTGRIIRFLNAKKPVFENHGYKFSLWAAGVFGFLSGNVAGLFGIGGGILKTPVMVNVFKVPVRIATATALSMIVITSLVSGATHYHLGHFNFELFLSCGGGFFAGAFVGNRLGLKLQDNSIKKIIAVSISLAGISVLVHSLLARK